MKRPSDWPLHFVLYPVIFKICPAPILVIIQEISKELQTGIACRWQLCPLIMLLCYNMEVEQTSMLHSVVIWKRTYFLGSTYLKSAILLSFL